MRYQKMAFLTLLLAVVLMTGGNAFALGCSTLSTADSANVPVFGDILTCIFDTLAVYATIKTLMVAIIPLMLVVWGAKGGFATIGSLFRRLTMTLKR